LHKGSNGDCFLDQLISVCRSLCVIY